MISSRSPEIPKARDQEPDQVFLTCSIRCSVPDRNQNTRNVGQWKGEGAALERGDKSPHSKWCRLPHTQSESDLALLVSPILGKQVPTNGQASRRRLWPGIVKRHNQVAFTN